MHTLIQKLARAKPTLSEDDAERLVAVIFAAISDRLAASGRVELRGFGSFSTRSRDARVGRYPRTGEAVAVRARRALHFKPGKGMRERLEVD